MMRVWLIVCVFLMSSGTLWAQTAQEWRDSLAVLNQLIRRHPKSTDLRLKKAAVNIELEQLDYAIEEYGRVLEIEPKNPAALFYRAYVNGLLRRYALACNDYETFLTIVPKHFEAHLGLIQMKRRLGRKLETMDEMNRLVQLFPDSAIAYAVRADYEAEQEQYEIALFDWDEAIERSPRNADFVVSKVHLFLMQKRNEEALYELEKAVRRGIPRAALSAWFDKCK